MDESSSATAPKSHPSHAREAQVAPFGESGAPWAIECGLASTEQYGPTRGDGVLRRCSHCVADVAPIGRGCCPRCGRFLRANTGALVHGGRRMSLPPERLSRREQLHDAVWADLGGDVPAIIAELAEDFVAACVLRDHLVEHLETTGTLTQRGARRAAFGIYLAMSSRVERLAAQLNLYRTEVRDRAGSEAIDAPSHNPVAALPTPALHLALSLLKRIHAGDALSDRDVGRLDVLRSLIRGTLTLPPEIATID